MNKHSKLTKSIATTLLAGMLTAGVASAQSNGPIYQLNRPQVQNNQFPGSTILRPDLQRPIVVNRPGGDQAWPAAIAAGVAVVSAVVEVVHRVTESWMPQPGLNLSRDALVRVGAYDR